METIYVKVNGQEPDKLHLDLIDVVVDTNVHLPAMFTLTIQESFDPVTNALKYIDGNIFQLGAEVKIEAETDETDDPRGRVKAVLMTGEITALEPSFMADGRPLLRVRGYDRCHRLTRGKKTRTFGDANPQGSGISEAAIIKKIAQQAGLSATVDPKLDSLKYFYVMQYNQTDLEFLQSRARLLGYQVYVEDKKLNFQKADFHRGKPTEAPGKLVLGQNLSRFEPRATLTGQINKATVKGWDPGKKQAIVGVSAPDTSKTVPQIGLGKKGSQAAQSAFGQAETFVIDYPVINQSQAKAIADAALAESESEFIQAEGTCLQGDPRLIAGRQVEITGVGTRFSGKYYLTEARHVYSQGGYRVTFSVTGRAPDTLSSLLSDSNGERRVIHGVVTAKVSSIDDPENLGRVKLMYPWLPQDSGADLASNWARIATPMGGKDRGFFYLPEVDDEVLVTFEHGDINFPYVVGILWNGIDKPPRGTANAHDKKVVNQRVLRSRSGHMIILDDTQGQEQIIIQDKGGKNKIVIDSKENTLTIEMEKDIMIKAKGNANLEATGNITLKATGDLSMECKNLSIKAQAAGAVQANSSLDLKATGALSLKGAQASVAADGMLDLKSSGMTKVAGNPIMLN